MYSETVDKAETVNVNASVQINSLFEIKSVAYFYFDNFCRLNSTIVTQKSVMLPLIEINF